MIESVGQLLEGEKLNKIKNFMINWLNPLRTSYKIVKDKFLLKERTFFITLILISTLRGLTQMNGDGVPYFFSNDVFESIFKESFKKNYINKINSV